METLQYNVVLLAVLALDVIYNVPRDIIAVVNFDRPGAIATLVLFCVIFTLLAVVILILLCLTVYATTTVRKRNRGQQQGQSGSEEEEANGTRCTAVLGFSCFLLFIVALLFFWGDNIYHIVLTYGEKLHCGRNCQERVLITAKVALGMSLIMIHTMPLLRDDEFIKSESFRSRKWIHSALTILTVQVKVDMIYSVVTTIVQPELHCESADLSLNTTFFVFSTLLGWFSLGILSKFNAYGFSVRTVLACALMLPSLPMFLLSDNKQPLDCFTRCGFPDSTNNTNSTMNSTVNSTAVDVTCKVTYGLRLGFMGMVLVFCIFILLVPACFTCCKRRSRTTQQEE